MRRLLPILLLSGCLGGSTVPFPRQEEALDVVWRQVYGQASRAPEVEWFHGTSLFGDTDGISWAGWKVQVADWLQDPAHLDFSKTALSHELMHMRTFERTGDIDPLHWRGDWDLVGSAEQMLADRGM